jgi:hypothetical protein
MTANKVKMRLGLWRQDERRTIKNNKSRKDAVGTDIRNKSRCSEDILIHDHDHAHHGINVQPKHAEKQPMTRDRDPNIMNPACRPEENESKTPRPEI